MVLTPLCLTKCQQSAQICSHTFIQLCSSASQSTTDISNKEITVIKAITNGLTGHRSKHLVVLKTWDRIISFRGKQSLSWAQRLACVHSTEAPRRDCHFAATYSSRNRDRVETRARISPRSVQRVHSETFPKPTWSRLGLLMETNHLRTL